MGSFKNIINFFNFSHIQDYYIQHLIYLQSNYKKYLPLDFLWISSFKLVNSIILKNVHNFYLVDPICKNSKILALASKYENFVV